jgi:hypothetical protein
MGVYRALLDTYIYKNIEDIHIKIKERGEGSRQNKSEKLEEA